MSPGEEKRLRETYREKMSMGAHLDQHLPVGCHQWSSPWHLLECPAENDAVAHLHLSIQNPAALLSVYPFLTGGHEKVFMEEENLTYASKQYFIAQVTHLRIVPTCRFSFGMSGQDSRV